MAGILFLNVLDIGRALGPNPRAATKEGVADWLTSEYLAHRRGSFTYDPAIQMLFNLFSNVQSPEDAAKWCLENGNPKGRRQNADAIRAIAPFVAENLSSCYRIGLTAVAIGRAQGETVYAGIKAPLVRVRDKQAFIVMPGFRMSFRPTDPQIDFACSFALATFGRDDHEVADFEYLYAGPAPIGKGRMFQAIHGKHRDVYDQDTLDGLLDIYVKGVALALERGAPVTRPAFRGYRVIDPDAPRFI